MTDKTTAGPDVRERLRQAGFEIIEGVKADEFEVRKNQCSYVLRREPQGQGFWATAGPPHFLIRGLECELEDQGYQKFWLSNGKRFPIRLQDLRALHDFDREVRDLVGLKALYNESLGTTCARTAYDRLEGRPDR